MNLSDLYAGIAIIIDDEIDEKGANINQIIEQIRKNNIPMVLEKELPRRDTITNLRNVSFILLDWELKGSNENRVIEYLKELTKIRVVPIFIFSDQDIDYIKNKLIEKDLYINGKPSNIFIKKKDQLVDNKLFETIEAWLASNPSMRVLKKWEIEYEEAKNKLFLDLFSINPYWPNILCSAFTDDNVDFGNSLSEVVSLNLKTRMHPIEFGIEPADTGTVTEDELKMVLMGTKFIRCDSLHPDYFAPGDVFQIPGNKFLINIRPECDCVPDRDKEEKIEDVDLYLLRGDKLTPGQLFNRYSEPRGQFDEHDSDAIVFSVYEGKSIIFGFKKLCVKKWGEVKTQRIGRLLPPYITRIQQRYALFIQRSGLPRTPAAAVPNPD